MLLRHSRVARFGAGGTLGGVKRVSTTQVYDYHAWMLSERARMACSAVHHPLVLEYMMRLHAKNQRIQQVLEESAGVTPEVALASRLRNSVNNSPFDYVRWNIVYRDELELSERVVTVLRRLEEAASLQEELEAKPQLSDDETELLSMASEDGDQCVAVLREMDVEIGAVMERRLDAGDVVGSSSRTWTIEVAGRAGGEEACLFAGDLVEMYKAYAAREHGWRVTTPSPGGDSGSDSEVAPGALTTSSVGDGATGFRLQITGENVYKYLHHEIGVHKVQRVPVTDQSGKMQTSTAVFTMMPVLDPVSVNVHEADCKFEFVRGSGPGGQGMQSSSNAVCLTHLPSGISVKCHQSRSALGNKDLALQMVAQQLLSRSMREQQSTLHSAWVNQWSSGERSEKMRTYNFPQNRVTDHRLGRDFPLRRFMEEPSELRALHDDLNAIDRQQQLITVLLQHIKGDFGSTV